MSSLVRYYQPLVKLGKFLQPFLLLLVRLYWGWMFFEAGLGKLQNIEKTAEFFSSIGIPFSTFSAYLVGNVEMIGGIFLFFGFLSRLATFFLAIVMFTAIFTTEQEAVQNFVTDPSLMVATAPFNYLLASLMIFCFGPGGFSIDWIGKKLLGVGKD